MHSAFPPAARRAALLAAALLLATLSVLAANGLVDPLGRSTAADPGTVEAAHRSRLEPGVRRDRGVRHGTGVDAPASRTPSPVPPSAAPVVPPTTASSSASAGEQPRREAGGAPFPASPVTRPAPAASPAPTVTQPAPTARPHAGATSRGTGGTFTDHARRTYTAGNGKSGRYLLYAGGIDPGRPVGLVVYVDGSGEFGVDNPDSSYALGGPSGLVAADRSRNLITLAVESPDQGCECWHTGDTAGNPDFLADLVEDVLGSYPVDTVWLAGFSSGAQEITRFLVPRHPELMRLGGGWVVFGGGGPPDGPTELTAAQMSGVRGHWFTGTADGEVPLTAAWGGRAGESWYAAHGVTTSHDWAAGVGHELGGRLGATVGRLVDGG